MSRAGDRDRFGEPEWARAVRAIARAREQMAAIPLDDTAAWASAAAEAAGVMAMWSARLETFCPGGPMAAAKPLLHRPWREIWWRKASAEQIAASWQAATAARRAAPPPPAAARFTRPV
ncbi:hypothetical protein [Nonomuraea gerenzanensis]|uniref:hypothetical protein n=1 Tax=Nonomuraea gerenzanensis TaxID=93944 RepID=UPI001CDA50A1|nr:hypothetical protein [Nonomuraea gerenzanensis]UBU09148.1 hypothetical protein LCN96_32780 [Nonomuraea gerenzanensis]